MWRANLKVLTNKECENAGRLKLPALFFIWELFWFIFCIFIRFIFVRKPVNQWILRKEETSFCGGNGKVWKAKTEGRTRKKTIKTK